MTLATLAEGTFIQVKIRDYNVAVSTTKYAFIPGIISIFFMNYTTIDV